MRCLELALVAAQAAVGCSAASTSSRIARHKILAAAATSEPATVTGLAGSDS